jgi:hypothetical protein
MKTLMRSLRNECRKPASIELVQGKNVGALLDAYRRRV